MRGPGPAANGVSGLRRALAVEEAPVEAHVEKQETSGAFGETDFADELCTAQRQRQQHQDCLGLPMPEPAGDSQYDGGVGPPYAALALSLCSQQWQDLGLDLDLLNVPPPPHTSARDTHDDVDAAAVSSSSSPSPSRGVQREVGTAPPSADTDDIYPIVDRIVALLLLRIVALVHSRAVAEANDGEADADVDAARDVSTGPVCNGEGSSRGGGGGEAAPLPNADDPSNPKLRSYSDLSTSTIARTELECAAAAAADAAKDHGTSAPASCTWPEPITPHVIAQLRQYVYQICAAYRAVHYHGIEHCYHVTLSANKLLDMLLNENVESSCDEEQVDAATSGSAAGPTRPRSRRRRRRRRRPMFGLRTDTLTHLAFVFSALIHDVDHTGITNRQLVDEGDELALLYNDQSVAEQRSLAVAFSTLLSPDFAQLRDVLFPTGDEYQRFRKVVINLVLTTDIASPERTQVVKSKWKEAFPSAAHVARERRRTSMAVGTAVSGAGACDSPKTSGVRARRTGRTPTLQSIQPVIEDEPPSILDEIGPKAPDEQAEHIRSENGESKAILDNAGEDGVNHKSNEDDTSGVKSRSKTSAESEVGHVSIVEPPPSGMQQDVPHTNQSTSAQADYTSSHSGPSHEEETLKASFFRLRPSMGMGYMKGETNSAATSTRAVAFARMESAGASLPSEAEEVASSAFHDGEEEDEVDVDYLSATSSSSIEAAAQEEEERANNFFVDEDQQGNFTMPGVTLSKMDKEDRVAYYSSLPLLDIGRPRVQSVRAATAPRLLTSSVRNTGVGGHALYRRYSLPNMTKSPRYEMRLGIRRAVDLTGQPIESFAPRRMLRREPSRDSLGSVPDGGDFDEPDELKASAILEHLMKAADVAAVLQGWDNLIKWSSRLFREQKASAIAHRGDDPEASWFEGQVLFMDIYIMPLAEKLAEPGIFDDETGALFAQCVQDNRARWLVEGRYKTEELIQEWAEQHGVG